jgi:hypothetical protein
VWLHHDHLYLRGQGAHPVIAKMKVLTMVEKLMVFRKMGDHSMDGLMMKA